MTGDGVILATRGAGRAAHDGSTAFLGDESLRGSGHAPHVLSVVRRVVAFAGRVDGGFRGAAFRLTILCRDGLCCGEEEEACTDDADSRVQGGTHRTPPW